jgi:hypothetical protein
MWHFLVHVGLLNDLALRRQTQGNLSAVPDLPISLNVSVQPVVRHLTKTLAATGFNESERRVESEQAA